MRALTDVLTLRGRSFLAAGAALTLCGMALGFVDLLRLGMLVIALPVITGFLARRHHLQLSVSRTVEPTRVQIDEPAIVTVRVENRGSSATPAMLAEEDVDDVLGDHPRFVIARLRRGSHTNLRYRTRAHVRGRHRLGPLALRLKDPFDLSVRLAQVPGTAELLVLPRVVPLGTERPHSTGVGAEGSVPHMVALHGEDDVSIREYRDGDDLRRIHWPSTAKTGSLMVRQEDRPARRRAVVLLDARASVHRGTGMTGSLEWAVTAAASVVAHLSSERFAVHLVTPAAAEAAAGTDSLTLDQALDALAVVTATGDESLPEAFHAARPLTSSGGLVMAVVGGMDEDEARSLAAMRQPGATGIAMVLDTPTFAPSRTDDLIGNQVETTIQTLTSAGWATARVDVDSTVPQAWSAVQLAGAGVPG